MHKARCRQASPQPGRGLKSALVIRSEQLDAVARTGCNAVKNNKTPKSTIQGKSLANASGRDPANHPEYRTNPRLPGLLTYIKMMIPN